MFRNTVTNASIARMIARDLSERQYHMFRPRPTTNAFLLQGKAVPGAVPTMLVKLPPGWVPTKMFTTEYLKKHIAVTPIIGLMGLWAVGVCGYTVYAALTRDVAYTRTGKQQHELVDLRNPRPLKLVTINQPYTPNPELAQLLDDINSAQKQQQEEKENKKCVTAEGEPCDCD